MKRWMFVVCLILATLSGAGCSSKPSKVLLPNGPVALETLPEASWPAAVKEWVSTATKGKADPVFDTKTVGDSTYLLVYGGRLPSQGYTVRFDRAEAKGGLVEVSYAIVGPAHPESSAVEFPVGVARMPRHDGAVHFPPFTGPVRLTGGI